jgi:hypothetical protein
MRPIFLVHPALSWLAIHTKDFFALVLVLEGHYRDLVDTCRRKRGFQLPLKGDRLESIQAFSSTRNPSFYPLKHLQDRHCRGIGVGGLGLASRYASLGFGSPL